MEKKKMTDEAIGCPTGEMKINGKCIKIEREISFFDKKTQKKRTFFYDGKTGIWVDEKGNTAKPDEISYNIEKYAAPSSINHD